MNNPTKLCILITALGAVNTACNNADALLEKGGLKGANARELRDEHAGMKPDAAKLYRKDEATGEDVVRVVVLTQPITDGNTEVDGKKGKFPLERGSDWSVLAADSLRGWLKGSDGAAGFFADAQETVKLDTKWDVRRGSWTSGGTDKKEWDYSLERANDTIRIVAPAGRRLGGEKGRVAWQVDVYNTHEPANRDEIKHAVQGASIVIFNGTYGEWDPKDIVGAGGETKILMINRCISEYFEDSYADVARDAGADLQIVSSRGLIHYGELANVNAALLGGLVRGSTWADLLESMPNRTLRTSTINGKDGMDDCKRRGGGYVWDAQGNVTCTLPPR